MHSKSCKSSLNGRTFDNKAEIMELEVVSVFFNIKFVKNLLLDA